MGDESWGGGVTELLLENHCHSFLISFLLAFLRIFYLERFLLLGKCGGAEGTAGRWCICLVGTRPWVPSLRVLGGGCWWPPPGEKKTSLVKFQLP